LVRFKVIESTEFLESTAANIEDWYGSSKIFEGGELQLFNKNVKQSITIISY